MKPFSFNYSQFESGIVVRLLQLTPTLYVIYYYYIRSQSRNRNTASSTRTLRPWLYVGTMKCNQIAHEYWVEWINHEVFVCQLKVLMDRVKSRNTSLIFSYIAISTHIPYSGIVVCLWWRVIGCTRSFYYILHCCSCVEVSVRFICKLHVTISNADEQ